MDVCEVSSYGFPSQTRTGQVQDPKITKLTRYQGQRYLAFSDSNVEP